MCQEKIRLVSENSHILAELIMSQVKQEITTVGAIIMIYSQQLMKLMEYMSPNHLLLQCMKV